MGKLTAAARKSIITIVGFLILIAGVILLVLPGPGILVIILSLIILSWEYEWAGRQLHRARNAQKRTLEKVREKKNNF
ncbi:PGPGW domain-containing protein [Candidatus Saccharibacteria bacterium]|nr:PGPGW domain-containing protein [Candidatus Saccharibacteria bacterium]